MNDLQTRIRDYLDRKKPARPAKVTLDVNIDADEEEEFQQAWDELKQAWKTPLIFFKILFAAFAVLIMLWAMVVVDIQNECYLDKECREWVEKNR